MTQPELVNIYDMQEKFETIGIVDWYDKIKGYGVLQNIYDHREYFVHKSKVDKNCLLLSKNDIVFFSPDYDQNRCREIAKNVRYINNPSQLSWVIQILMDKEHISDNILERIIYNYLKFHLTSEDRNIQEAFTDLTGIILSFLLKKESTSILYATFENAIVSLFGKEDSTKFIESIELTFMDKLPPHIFFHLLDIIKSSYIKFIFAFQATDYTEEVINNVIESSGSSLKILSELIRFTQDINNDCIKESLNKDKSLITNNCFWRGIHGENIIEKTIFQILSSYNMTDLKLLVDNEFLRHIDITYFTDERYDDYRSLMIYIIKKGVANSIDVHFVEENIDCFSASDLINLKHHYDLSDADASKLFLSFTRNLLLNPQKASYDEIILFGQELSDVYNWIMDNHAYLADNADEEFHTLLICLYKASLVHFIDENFVIYYINEFSISEIANILGDNQVNVSQKKQVLSALFENILRTSSYDMISRLRTVCQKAEDLLSDDYQSWLSKICSTLSSDEQYSLWTKKISEIYPSSYIRENLFRSNEEGYIKFYDFYQENLVSADCACDELWNSLHQIESVSDRPSFYKILYCIKYLVAINNSYIERIEQEKNDFYTLFLWFLSYSDLFDYELLCRLFIYFLPADQVQIIKRLFFMMEEGKIQLDVKMLDKLLRVDADLYKLISEQHPEIPIDVSSEIVIKALVHLTETGKFSSDKEVLSIVIRAGQYSKNEKIKIGCYFDECKGRIKYRWNGNRPECGRVKQIDDNSFGVEIYPYYGGEIGRFNENSWNDSFHSIVAAIKNITGRRWNKEKSYWEVPTDARDRLFELAEGFGLSIDGTKNPHMKIFEEEYGGKPPRVNYCEGRPAQNQDEYVRKDFLWCRNSKCFSGCVKEHAKEEWENYTLLDFCRILGLDTDSTDSEGRTVRYGKYLSFSSIINRANSIIEHLYCRGCREMLEPINISNYHTHLVTHFHCTNKTCEKYDQSIYISKCFNWKCYGVIDDRDTQKCPNGWNICPECGSCCSNRTAGQRIANNKELGIQTRPYLINFYNMKLGHLEKREFYCWKCGQPMNHIGDNVYNCPICGVTYDRKKYDFEQRYSTIST